MACIDPGYTRLIIVGVKKPTPDASSRDRLLEGQDVTLVTFERLPVGVFDSRGLMPAFESSKCDFNIGIVSFTGVDFVKEGENSPIHLVPSYGTSFVVTYPSRYDDLFLDMIDETIESAVANGCDILLFPELTISPSALDVIKQSLHGLSERSRLKLVVAGSTYELNGDGSAGDNVCHIFDAHGQEIGRHYKRMPVELNLDGNEFVEALEHPGWQTTIIDIEDIGRVVVGICKDLATNDDYVTRLASDFEADLVLLPAMSSSLNYAFSEPTRDLAKQHLVVSVVCNQCGARSSIASEEELEYGRVVAPAEGDGVNRKQAGYTELALRRKPGCLERCRTAYVNENPICCLKKVRIVNELAGHGFRLIEENVCI